MGQSSLESFDLDRFSERLSSESDRACAVLGAALVDARLEAIFRSRLQEFQGELLENAGPISSFSARIKIARALRWISDDVRADLDTIRKIRNEFAHSFDHELSFADASISARCGNLRIASAFIGGFEDAIAKPRRNLSTGALRAMQDAFVGPRKRYEVAVDFIAQHLNDVRLGEVDDEGRLMMLVHALSANTSITIKATAHVGPPKEKAPD